MERQRKAVILKILQRMVQKVLSAGKTVLGKYPKQIRLAWDVFNIGIIGLNSFIMLLYKVEPYQGIYVVICFGAGAYALVLLLQAVLLRKQSEKRQTVAYLTRKIFRLIYTALYLTVIMLDVIRVTAAPDEGREQVLSYYGFLFLWAALWGTNGFWMKKILRKCKAALEKRRNDGKKLLNVPEL